MPQPIVIAHHLIFTAYGWWLPNDPRGSSSHTIRIDLIGELGDLHFGRKRVQPAGGEVAAFYGEAATRLRHDLRMFDNRDRKMIAEAFAQVIEAQRYTCWACAIMPDHVHVIIRKHRDQAEEMIANLQDLSRLRLRATARFDAIHPIWGGPGWKVFLDHPGEVRRTVKYVEDNPRKWYAGSLPDQRWPFVVPYDGWPLHEGHSENSPYVKRLKAAGRYP